MHPIEAFVRSPVKVAVGVLLVALFGIVALLRMPMQLTPEVQVPTITVETRWPGASPQEIEREIVQEQEEHLKSVEGLVKLSSESMDSMGRITLEFQVGTAIQEALLKVNSRLQQVREYPEDADQPVISTSNVADRPIAWFVLSARRPTAAELDAFEARYPALREELGLVRRSFNPGLAMLRLRKLAAEHPEVNELLPSGIEVDKLRRFCEDVIEARFERVPGVSNSNVIGGVEEEMQVVVDPARLAARQITIDDVRRTLRDQNKDTSGGDFWEGKRRYVVRTLGQFRSPEQVEMQLLAMRDGAPVYIGDVAEVRLGYKKPDGLVQRFGTSSIAINANRETGANVLDVMQGLRDANRELNQRILFKRGLELTQVYDETEYIYSAIGLVNSNIVVGGILTVGVLLLFLRSGRSTLVIGLAIPTSVIGTFLVLNLLGRSLNVISLAGLAFAVGMLVDNAIVVLENIYSHYQRGESPFSAAVSATKEVWGAVAASTLTTLAVFLPVLFIQEEAGQLFRDIALAISAAVGLSLLVSITVIPTATARLLRERAGGQGDRPPRGAAPSGPPQTDAVHGPAGFLAPVDRLAGAFVDRVGRLNTWLLGGIGRRLVAVSLFVGVSVAFTYLLWPKVEYLPSGNRNLVFGIILPPPGYNIDQLVALGKTVESELEPYWNTDPETQDLSKLPYPAIADFFYVARGRQVFLGVRAVDPTKAGKLVDLVQSVRPKLPGTFVVAKQSSLFEQGLTAGRTVDIEITGPELPQLVALGGQVMGRVMGDEVLSPADPTRPRVQARPVPSLDLSSPELHLEPKLVEGADLGVSALDLGYTVDALVDGAYASDYFVGAHKIDLTIIGKDIYVQRTQDVETLPIATPTGRLVPLSALARVRLGSGPEQVNHRERLRAITIEISPPPELALETALDRIRSEIVAPLEASGQLDGEYQIRLSGTADKLRQTWTALRWNVLLALVITYLLMAALFESWLYPLVIIFSVPLGAVGGVAGLQFLNVYLGFTGQVPQALDVVTMLGFVILIGTVVNNPILIIDQSLNLIRGEGMRSRAAIVAAVRSRIRPIFMTTMTTVLGLAPLVLFPGAGSELYRGLGAVVLGGLMVSTAFTLVLVPALFSLMMDARDAIFGTAESGDSAALPGTAIDEAAAWPDERPVESPGRERRPLDAKIVPRAVAEEAARQSDNGEPADEASRGRGRDDEERPRSRPVGSPK